MSIKLSDQEVRLLHELAGQLASELTGYNALLASLNKQHKSATERWHSVNTSLTGVLELLRNNGGEK